MLAISLLAIYNLAGIENTKRPQISLVNNFVISKGEEEPTKTPTINDIAWEEDTQVHKIMY